MSGTFVKLTESYKQTNLTVTLKNEGKPALAENFTVYYYCDDPPVTQYWEKIASPTIVDYGNGTSFISFIADTKNRNDPLYVAVNCIDHRGISVWANATCVER
jgi:hypothetical protein